MKIQVGCLLLLMLLNYALCFPGENKAKNPSGNQPSGNTKDATQKKLQENLAAKDEHVNEKAKFGKALDSAPKEGGQNQRQILDKTHKQKSLPDGAELKENKFAQGNQQQLSQMCPQCIAGAVQSKQVPKKPKMPSPQEALGLTELKPKKPAEVVGQINIPINQLKQVYAPHNAAYPTWITPNLQRGHPYVFPYRVVAGNGRASFRRNQDSPKKARLDQELQVTSPLKSLKKGKIKATNLAKQIKTKKQSKRHDIIKAPGKKTHKNKKTGKANLELKKVRGSEKKATKKGHISNKETKEEEGEKGAKNDLKKAHEREMEEHESGSGSDKEGSSAAMQNLPVRLRRSSVGIVPVKRMKVKKIYV